jgi:hypothetical protein
MVKGGTIKLSAELEARAFSLLVGSPKRVCRGVFIAENAHRGGTLLYTYGENTLVQVSST